LDQLILEKAIVLENIYYDLDKAEIRPDAALELDKLVKILTDNPAIRIELSSHTDSRSSDAYNLDLSQRRAQSAVDYMVSKGIAADRLVAKGYGETQLIIKDAKTEEEHQTNRRTEFKVIEIREQ
jgi:outer membrane protein OmpA-like peptidoglycan-associated protein